MQKKWFNPWSKEWEAALKKQVSLEKINEHYNISRANAEKYLEEITKDY